MRIVVKVGTSTLTHATGRLNIRHVETLCKVLSDVKNAGHEIVLVSSGAIGARGLNTKFIFSGMYQRQLIISTGSNRSSAGRSMRS